MISDYDYTELRLEDQSFTDLVLVTIKDIYCEYAGTQVKGQVEALLERSDLRYGNIN